MISSWDAIVESFRDTIRENIKKETLYKYAITEKYLDEFLLTRICEGETFDDWYERAKKAKEIYER